MTPNWARAQLRPKYQCTVQSTSTWCLAIAYTANLEAVQSPDPSNPPYTHQKQLLLLLLLRLLLLLNESHSPNPSLFGSDRSHPRGNSFGNGNQRLMFAKPPTKQRIQLVGFRSISDSKAALQVTGFSSKTRSHPLLLWMAEILHHPRNPEDSPANANEQWFPMCCKTGSVHAQYLPKSRLFFGSAQRRCGSRKLPGEARNAWDLNMGGHPKDGFPFGVCQKGDHQKQTNTQTHKHTHTHLKCGQGCNSGMPILMIAVSLGGLPTESGRGSNPIFHDHGPSHLKGSEGTLEAICISLKNCLGGRYSCLFLDKR